MLRKNAAASDSGGTLLSTVTGPLSTNSVIATGIQLHMQVRLAAADYVELFVLQDSGGALVLRGSVLAHRFGALWLSA